MAKKDHLHITKGQIDSTIASGIKNAFMYNNGARRRMKQTVTEFDRKKQIAENKARQNEKALEAAYQKNLDLLNKKITETAMTDFESEIAQYSSDMGSTSYAPETFPVAAETPPSEFVASLDAPKQETANEHAN